MIREALTFNDVLLVPKYSEIRTRKSVDLSTNLTKNIKLKIPIISSNMDTVTEDKMAIAMASYGGIGIIHRFLSIKDQVNLVRKVKRHINYKIYDPYTINLNDTYNDFLNLVKEKGVKGFPVVNKTNKLCGIITNRDIIFANKSTIIRDIMTPIDKLNYAEDTIDLDTAFNLMAKYKVEKLPLVKNKKTLELTGLITIRDIIHYREINKISTVDKMGRLMVGAAIGVKMNHDLERAEALVNADVDVLVVDVAHGHHILVKEMIIELKHRYPHIDIIAGNVVTAAATKFLIEAGADAVKIGIGSGSICTTRIMTGCGVPQLTALFDCFAIAKKYNIPIISDGGNSGIIGNIFKALSTGASTIMLGGFLAGTDESPGQVLVRDGKRVKLYRGMSGYGANMSRRYNIENVDNITDIIPEGVDGYKPYKGSVKEILYQICGGIKSGMSYCGVDELIKLVDRVEFVKITDAGRKNSNFHSISII